MDGLVFKDFVLALPEHSVSGGGAYDGLVAATAAAHAASLVTCDRRAALVYESYGLRATFIG
jgi:predicted nucleic acid-binding protein